MKNSLVAMASIIALGILYVLLPGAVHTYRLLRRKKVLQCPETKGLAEVDIDAGHAAISSVLGSPELRVKNCTLWPKMKSCDEGCLGQREGR